MTTSAQTDAELLALARQGDETAFAELYVRHEAAALRLARGYPRAGDADDLVSEAFTRVLRALRQGAGPTQAFRAYLFVALRRIAAARIARRQDDPYNEVPEPVRSAAAAAAAPPAASGSTGAGGGTGSLFGSDADAEDRRIVVDAYESLPDRWQSVLWHTAVEGHPPRDLGPALGLSANAASALAYRAREKLRQAYLQAHLRAAPRPGCDPHRSRLGAYVRDGLGPRDRVTTDEHLGGCVSCRALVDELSDINRLLVRSLVPLFISTASISGPQAVGTAAAAATAARLGTRPSRYGARRASRLADKPGVATGAVVAAAALVTVMVAVLADHAMPPAPLNLPPVPSSGPSTSGPSTSDEAAMPVRPDREGTGADEPVVVDRPEPRRPRPPARPPASDAGITGSGPGLPSSDPSSWSSSPPANRSRGSSGRSGGSTAPAVPTRPVVTTPPPVSEPAPHPPPHHPVTTTPPTTQPPTTTPPTTPPTTPSTVPPTTAPPSTVPPPYQHPGGGGLRSCICDILGSILRGLL